MQTTTNIHTYIRTYTSICIYTDLCGDINNRLYRKIRATSRNIQIGEEKKWCNSARSRGQLCTHTHACRSYDTDIYIQTIYTCVTILMCFSHLAAFGHLLSFLPDRLRVPTSAPHTSLPIAGNREPRAHRQPPSAAFKCGCNVVFRSQIKFSVLNFGRKCLARTPLLVLLYCICEISISGAFLH